MENKGGMFMVRKLSDSKGFASRVADRLRRGFCPDFAVDFAAAIGPGRFLKLAADFYNGAIPESMPPNIRAFFSSELEDHKQTVSALDRMFANSVGGVKTNV